MTTKERIQKYCTRESHSIREIEIPYWQEKQDGEKVARMQQRLEDIAAVRRFLRRYPHDELDFQRFPCANGTEVLAAILGYRDAWDAALAAHQVGQTVRFLKVHHAMSAALKDQVGKTGEIVGEDSVAGLEKKYLIRFSSASPAANQFWIKARYIAV
ncbi:MAG: hypothetical protein AAFY20_18735 [Cyanobacteria bacterium J06639_14]